jgi:acyl-homoserine lactone acylase PvdQ
MEPWTVYKSVAVTQLLARIFGQAGGDELDRLSELQTNGQAWFDLNRPINDPNAPTTIQGGGSASFRDWSYSGMRVREAVIQSINSKRYELSTLARSLGLPWKFGSFAVLISTAKSNSGHVMLLGAPQMGEPQPDSTQIAHEVELRCPAFQVGGMTIAGLPSVVIGHTEHHAWTLTSGLSDNSDVYIDSTRDASFSQYFHNGQWLDFEVIQDTIVSLGSKVPFTHYRTIHGPVFEEDLQNHQVFSMKMTFWGQELDLLKFNYGIIRATNLQEFEAAAALMPMSFNLFYADQDQKIKFWHTGKFQDRSDGVDPRLPHKGDGSEEWGGFRKFADLPAADHLTQDYFVNWNNKPVVWWDNGDNVPWIGPDGVTDIDNFVGPINSFTFENLKDVPRQINSKGTYEQVIEFTGSEIIDENILPPGQSGFISLSGQRSPHFSDQWSLYVNWQFKDMEFGETPVSVATGGQIPLKFALRQNYPNPFNPVTTISYQLPQSANVLLTVYNMQGQRVQTLVKEFQAAGTHKVVWDARGVSSGVYFYRITAGDFSAVRKGVVLK